MARLDGEVGRLLHRLVQRQRMVIGVGVAGLEELMELEGHRHGCASPIGTNSGTARAMLISLSPFYPLQLRHIERTIFCSLMKIMLRLLTSMKNIHARARQQS